MASTSTEAQAQELEEGLHYFAIEDLERGEIVQRGQAGSNGIAFDGLLLAPNTAYRAYLLQAATFRIGRIDFTTGAPGTRLELGAIVLRASSSLDSDGDLLNDLAESVVGTSKVMVDTDGDLVSDAEEVRSGEDPLSGIPARTGVIATVDLPGDATTVDASGSLAAIGHSGQVTLANVFAGMQPEIVARVDTLGTAWRLAMSDDLVAVADGASGLTVIDAADPPAARVIHNVPSLLLGGSAVSVVAQARVAYVGLETGQVVAVDMQGGTVLDRVGLAQTSVVDLSIAGNVLYAVTREHVHAIPLGGPSLQATASVQANVFLGYERVVAGEDLLYAVHVRGINSFDLSDPAQPVLISDTFSVLVGWLGFGLDGSGSALASRGPDASPSGPRDVTLYDLSDPTQTDVAITTFPTPGIARAIVVANGYGLVADGEAGLQVVNFRPADTAGVPPSISLAFSFDPVIGAEGGDLVFVRALVSDDAGIRAVEFTVDGETVVDPIYPYEFSFVAPRPSEQPTMTIQARVFDIGGNFTFSQQWIVDLVPDATPPQVQDTAPRDGGMLSQAGSAAALFSEALDPASLAGQVALVEAGPDLVLGTADDAPVSISVEFRPEVRRLFLTPTAGGSLPPGSYRASLGAAIADPQGNVLGTTFEWSFLIFGGSEEDRDSDGLPDLLELALNLDPDKPSTFDDGVLDGDRDADGDGLTNTFEALVLGSDLQDPDSSMNGVPDGLEDPDLDRLNNLGEQSALTDPYVRDSDGDLFTDYDEVLEGSRGNDPLSLPLGFAFEALSTRNTQVPVDTATSQLSTRNDSQRDRLDTATDQLSVRNTASPGAVAGEASGPAISVENQTSSP